MNVPGVIPEYKPDHDVDDDEDDDGVKNSGSDVDSSVAQERKIIVANQLPVRAYRDAVSKKWCFELDNDSLYLQPKDGLGPDVEVYYVGCLKAEIDSSDQEEVAQLLHDKFRCVPTFLSVDIQNKFYHGFCKHYLWPLFHYMMPLSPSHKIHIVIKLPPPVSICQRHQ